MADLAAFDFDGTLTNGGSVLPYLETLAGRRRVAAALARLSPRLAYAAVLGGRAADETKEQLFELLLSDVPIERAIAVGVDFARQHVGGRLRRDAKERLDWHRARGDRVLVVSASPELYVAPAGELLGVDAVVATRLAVAGGTLTGKYEGANCRGEEKIHRVREWVRTAGGTPTRLWAYGNSRGDLRLLAEADVGVNLGRLGRLGRLHRYPTLAALASRDGTSDGGASP